MVTTTEIANKAFVEQIDKFRDEAVNLYFVNRISRCIPKFTYEDEMRKILIGMCSYANVNNSDIHKFDEHIEHIESHEFFVNCDRDMFRIIGDIYNEICGEE